MIGKKILAVQTSSSFLPLGSFIVSFPKSNLMEGMSCSLFLPSCPRLQNADPAIKSCKQAPRDDASHASGSQCCWCSAPGKCIPLATAPIWAAELQRRCLVAAAEMTDPTRNGFVGAMAARSELGPATAADRTSYRNRLKTTLKDSWYGFPLGSCLRMVGMSRESRRRTRDSVRESVRVGFSMASDSYKSANHATVSASGRCLTICKREEAAVTGLERESAARICWSIPGVGWDGLYNSASLSMRWFTRTGSLGLGVGIIRPLTSLWLNVVPVWINALFVDPDVNEVETPSDSSHRRAFLGTAPAQHVRLLTYSYYHWHKPQNVPLPRLPPPRLGPFPFPPPTHSYTTTFVPYTPPTKYNPVEEDWWRGFICPLHRRSPHGAVDVKSPASAHPVDY